MISNLQNCKNAKISEQNTVYECDHRHLISCVDLLQAGAGPNIESHNGVTALFLQFSCFHYFHYTSNLLPIEVADNRILKFSVNNSIMKEFVKSGAKVVSTRSKANPNFNISVLEVLYASRREKISENFDISVAILFNSYNYAINVFILD